MNRVLSLYHELLESYGEQGWWPARTRYEVVVGALLTQNTNWKNAEKAIDNLKGEGCLEPATILELPREELEKMIRPSGFYRQKAERLKLLTSKYLEITDPGIAGTRDELLSVKGVGKETADSIMLYAFDMPIFVIDNYTKRFCKKKQLRITGGYEDYRSFFEKHLPKSVKIYKEYHALIVEWGKRQSTTAC